MPFTIKVDSERRFRVTTFSGIVTDATVFEAFHAAKAYDPTMSSLVDCRPVGSLHLTIEGAHALGEELKRRRLAGDRRVAVVAPPTMVYGISRLLTAITSVALPDARVFDEYDRAVEWVPSEGSTS
jgi:hypothetical protein